MCEDCSKFKIFFVYNLSPKISTYVNSFNPHNNCPREVLLLPNLTNEEAEANGVEGTCITSKWDPGRPTLNSWLFIKSHMWSAKRSPQTYLFLISGICECCLTRGKGHCRGDWGSWDGTLFWAIWWPQCDHRCPHEEEELGGRFDYKRWCEMETGRRKMMWFQEGVRSQTMPVACLVTSWFWPCQGRILDFWPPGLYNNKLSHYVCGNLL